MQYETPQDLLFCDNETNVPKLFGAPDAHGYFKDAFHEYIVHGNTGAVNPARTGTKAAGVYAFDVPAGSSAAARRAAPSSPSRAHRRTWPRCRPGARSRPDARSRATTV